MAKGTQRKRYKSNEYVEDPDLGFSIDASIVDPEIMKDPVKLLKWLGETGERPESNSCDLGKGGIPHDRQRESSYAVESEQLSSISQSTEKEYNTSGGMASKELLAMPMNCDCDVPWEVSYLRRHGIRCVDFRPRGGALWVFGDYGIAVEIGYLRSCGLGFRFKAEGSNATQGTPGWWTNDESPARPKSESVSNFSALTDADSQKGRVAFNAEEVSSREVKTQEGVNPLTIAAVSMTAKNSAVDAVASERTHFEGLSVSRLGLRHELEEYQSKKGRGFTSPEDEARALSKTIAIAYSANPEAANKIWRHFQPVDSSFSEKDFRHSVIQLFDSLTAYLSYGDIANLVARDRDRLKLIVQCDYRDGDQLSAICKIFIGFLRNGDLDACQDCIHLSDQLPSLPNVEPTVKISAAYAANALVMAGDKASEQALNFLKWLAKCSYYPASLLAQICLYMKSKASNWQGDCFLRDSSKIGLTGAFEDLLWKQRLASSERIRLDCLQNCITHLGESRFLPGTNIADETNANNWSKLEYFVHLASVRLPVALKYCAWSNDISEGLLRLWIVKGEWDQFAEGLACFLRSSKEAKFHLSERTWRLLRQSMDAYFDAASSERRDCYGRRFNIITERNVGAFIDAVRNACSKASSSLLSGDLRLEIEAFEQKVNKSNSAKLNDSSKLANDHVPVDALTDDDYAAPLAVPELVGILFGISCDGRVNETEANTLRAWLSGVDAKGDRRILCVKNLLERTLDDGVLDEREERELLSLFNKIIDFAMGTRSQKGVTYSGETSKNASNKTEESAEPWDVVHARKIGLQCVDLRDQGGALWILGGNCVRPLLADFKEQGMRFSYSARGSVGTNHRAGWWTRDVVRKPVVKKRSSVDTDQSDVALARGNNLRIISPVNIKDISVCLVLLGGGSVSVRASDVVYAESIGSYSIVYTEEESYKVAPRLARLEGIFEGCGFLRVHRSFLVNTSEICDIRENKRGSFVLSLKHSDRRIPAHSTLRMKFISIFGNNAIKS